MPQREIQIEKSELPADAKKASKEIDKRLRKLDEHLKIVLGKLGRDKVFKKNQY